MDWQKCMNNAMAYIDDNLSEKINYEIVAQMVSCSEYEFRRMFSFLAQMPISEYVRKRRLTVSIDNIQNGEKLIEIAQRYGYDSQAAFSRAFKQMHGVSPSKARKKDVTLKPFQRLTFKLFLKEDDLMENDTNRRMHIMGSRTGVYAVSMENDSKEIHKMNESFWSDMGTESVGGTALPDYGAFISEENCQFFKNVSGKRVLEIGCGTGHSLHYLGKLQASELWGIDISQCQIDKTRTYLAEHNFTANLICSPMEMACGLPESYFDYVYSVYGIGWTTDLDLTFNRVASYLKKDGLFIFSWSHPIHKCVSPEEDTLVFKKSYFDESWYSVALDGGHFSLADRKLSTYINALAKAGFYIEELVEVSDENSLNGKTSRFAQKAKMLPVTFVIKARKI